MKTKQLLKHTGVGTGGALLKSLPSLLLLLVLAGPLKAQLTETTNLQKRGLNYVSATQKLAKRLEAGEAGTNGVDQPATFTISGIPAGAVIEKAIVWVGTSGSGIPVTLTIQNPASAMSSVPMTLIGSGVDVCWYYPGSYSYRADVTSAISGNGNYLISGLPTDPLWASFDPGPSENDTDGATLFIIYSDNTASYQGTLVIKDGLTSDAGNVDRSQTVSNFTAPASTMNAKAFSIFLDLQQAPTLTMNGTTAAYTADFWNFIEAGTTLASGQTSAAYSLSSSGDCIGWVVAGLYYQSALPEADLSITKTDGVTTATPGGSVTYTITASNAGPSSVTGATVADTYPASLTNVTWTCLGAGGGTCTAAGAGNLNDAVNLPSGGSVTYTVTATISPSATGSLSNTATVTAPQGTTDPNPDNNSATDTDNLTPSADLSITKTDGVTTATPGGIVTYTITASNAGPSNVTGATVADTYPASIIAASWTCAGSGGGTCTAAGAGNINDLVNLPSGGSVTYTVTATISPSATAPGSLSNTATVTTPQGTTDPNSGNNSATDTDNLVCPTIMLTNPSITDVTCNGASTGSISLSASGGSGAVTYTLNPGNVQNSTGSFTGLAAGSYTVTATSPSTCSATSGTITIIQPPAISVSIGGNTSVLYGYGSSCTTLTASASGGTPGYTYAWNNGTQGPTLNVCPMQTTTYTVTVTDAANCTTTKQVTVTVNDVRCGYGGVRVCLGGRELCIAQYLVPTYLRLGATLGGCNTPVPSRIGYEPEAAEPALSLRVKAYPNPTRGTVKLEVHSVVAGAVQFEVLDLAGVAVQKKTQEQLVGGRNEVELRLGVLPAGNYLIRCVDSLGQQAVVRVNKQ